MPVAVPPRAWLLASLAAAPWLFWACPPCWVLALLSPADGPEQPQASALGGTDTGRSTASCIG